MGWGDLSRLNRKHVLPFVGEINLMGRLRRRWWYCNRLKGNGIEMNGFDRRFRDVRLLGDEFWRDGDGNFGNDFGFRLQGHWSVKAELLHRRYCFLRCLLFDGNVHRYVRGDDRRRWQWNLCRLSGPHGDGRRRGRWSAGHCRRAQSVPFCRVQVSCRLVGVSKLFVNITQVLTNASGVRVASCPRVQAGQTLIQRHILRGQGQRGFQRRNCFGRDIIRDVQFGISERRLNGSFRWRIIALVDRRRSFVQLFHHQGLSGFFASQGASGRIFAQFGQHLPVILGVERVLRFHLREFFIEVARFREIASLGARMRLKLDDLRAVGVVARFLQQPQH